MQAQNSDLSISRLMVSTYAGAHLNLRDGQQSLINGGCREGEKQSPERNPPQPDHSGPGIGPIAFPRPETVGLEIMLLHGHEPPNAAWPFIGLRLPPCP